MVELYHAYMQDVLSGKEVAGLYVRQAVERQQKDLGLQNDKNFPYYFDESEAGRWLTFIGLLKHTSGEWKGKRFLIQPFQAFRWACIFGWHRKDGRGRRFRRAYIEVARKQGKTEEAAAIALGGLVIDGENSPQVYSAATTRQQAKIVFGAAKIMARELMAESPAAKKVIGIRAHKIEGIVNDGIFEPLSSDAWTLDGLSPSVAIVDEYHAHPTSEVLEVIETGMGARSSPLSYIITTAGFDMASPCYTLRESAIGILSGRQQDDTFFAAIYTLDAGDDWNDKNVWIKSNPQIGVTPTWEYMDSKYQKALNEGGQAEVEFKTKNLNVWTTSSDVWIPDEIWQACPGELDSDSLLGKSCFAGLDFASISDFTALVLLFPPDESRKEYALLPFFWIPREKLKERARRWPDVFRWEKMGLVNVIEGNVIDPDVLEAGVKEILAKYRPVVVGYDPFNAWLTIGKLQEAGLPMDRYRNIKSDMSPAAKEFERMIRLKQINHGGNPVLRWMATQVVPKYDQQSNLMLDRAGHDRASKIDGIVASVIAVGEMLKNPEVEVYSQDDLFLI